MCIISGIYCPQAEATKAESRSEAVCLGAGIYPEQLSGLRFNEKKALHNARLKPPLTHAPRYPHNTLTLMSPRCPRGAAPGSHALFPDPAPHCLQREAG